jgi:hypothetical protein
MPISSGVAKVAKRGISWRLALLLGVLLIGGCSDTEPLDGGRIFSPIIESVPSPSKESLAARGKIESESIIADVDESVKTRAQQSVRAVYKSISGNDGSSTDVSGSFFLPIGSTPPGGWPVVAFAHGTIGLANGCGPSLTGDLKGYAATVGSLLSLGYAVAMTDYEGLGSSGVHPYLEPRTAAYNVIDSVRALRTLFPTVSSRWLAFGESQGGQAVWAANEDAASYGEGLTLVGSIALSPVSNITALADLATRGSLSSDQRMLMPAVVVGVARSQGLPVQDYLHGVSDSELDELIGCDNSTRQKAANQLTADSVRPIDQAASDRLVNALRRTALPQRELSAPMIVVNGRLDQLLSPTWINQSVAESCAMGSSVTHVEKKKEGHAISPDESLIKWLTARFRGEPVPNGCGS